MADQITNCQTIKAGATIKHHIVTYTLDTGEIFQVYVDASDMTDPTDNTEITSKANTEAAKVKTSMTATALTNTPSSALNGNVTL